MKIKVAFICFIVFYFNSTSTFSQYFVELSESPVSSNLRATVLKYFTSPKQAALVFESNLPLKFDSNKENLGEIIKTGTYQILLVSSGSNAISVIYNNTPTVLNFGIIVDVDKGPEIAGLKDKEIKLYKVSLQTRLKIDDITDDEVKRGGRKTVLGPNPSDALVVLRVNPSKLDIEISSDNLSDVVFDSKSGEYLVYLKTKGLEENSKPVNVVLRENNGNERAISIYSLVPKDYRVYEVTKYEDVPTTVSEGKAQLAINSNVIGASIELDDIETKYTTPFLREINSGKTKITLKKSKYLTFDTTLNLVPQQKINLNVNMVPSWVDFSVSVKPSNARIILNDKVIGTGNVELKGISNGLNPGSYSLKVDLLNHRTYSSSLDLKSGDVKDVKVELEPILGRIKVNSNANKAEVFLNGKSFGFTPFDKNVIIGDYSLALVKEGHRQESKTFTLAEGQVKDFDIPMVNYARILRPLKGKATLSYLIGLVGMGSGVYFMLSGNSNYELYQKSQSRQEASDLRAKVEFADKIFPIGFATGGVGMLGGIIFSSKIGKYKKQWGLSSLPITNRGGLALTYNF